MVFSGPVDNACIPGVIDETGGPDAITIDAGPSATITLACNADKAYINNLRNTRIVNDGSGNVAVGLICSGQIIGVGHNVGINSQATEEIPQNEDSADSYMSVLGADYKLSAIDEEEEDSSTPNTEHGGPCDDPNTGWLGI